MTTGGRTLFDQVVAATGLSEIVAPFTVTRLLVRAGVAPRDLDQESLSRALPELERGIRVYLSEEEHAAAVERLRALAGVRA